MRRAFRALKLGSCLVVFAGCGESGPGAPGDSPEPNSPSDPNPRPPGGSHAEPGRAVSLALSAAQQGELAALQSVLASTAELTDTALLAQHAVAHTSLGYDPASASGMELIQASPLALRAADLEVLHKQGFVISSARKFPTFTYGYTNIYMADLPVYISADAILSALHSSYDDILKTLEQEFLIPQLTSLLAGMRANLPRASLSAESKADLDMYLGVAEALLKGKAVAGSTKEITSEIASYVQLASKASGTKVVKLFGVERDVDFSQFVVRGHYKDDPALEAYFRAMMWLGRTDFRLIETQGDGTQVFRRRQFDAMLALRSLLDASLLEQHRKIESVIKAFVGESDNMVVEEIDPLLSALGVSSPDAASGLGDEQIAQAIIDGGFGAQEIASQLIVNEIGKTLPLSRTFMLFGQRYVIDSHVFSNVTWARTKAKRMMPDPLDVAFAALGNDDAAPLLAGALATYQYAPNLKSTRLLVEAHDPSFWEKNLYNRWLFALRTLSPNAETATPTEVGLPAVAGTEPWGRRILNTQLASWAELRHDTILYAKQSYTDGAACEYPDAYVDPYPAFYEAVEGFAAHGRELAIVAESKPTLANRIVSYFERVASVAGTLRGMAEQQRIGEPFTDEQLAFVNRAVALTSAGCVPDGSEGWYADLFFYNAKSIQYAPTIADVHTQPTDEGGTPVGRVLHVGTGNPRLMVVTADTCQGPRAYVGVASAYHEVVTENFDRLDDQRWATMAQEAQDVPWTNDIVAR